MKTIDAKSLYDSCEKKCNGYPNSDSACSHALTIRSDYISPEEFAEYISTIAKEAAELYASGIAKERDELKEENERLKKENESKLKNY